MPDDFNDLDPSLENDELPTDAETASIATLANRQKAAEAEVVAATERLQRALNDYRLIAEVQLPNALKAAGTTGLTTTTGFEIKLRTTYDGKQLTTPGGLAWVEANGGSPLIKTAILVELDRGDLDAAREILALLRSNRHANKFRTLALNESVHAQTIGKFVRELIEHQHKDPPLDLLGVHRRSYAVVGDRPQSVDLKGFTKR